VSTYYSNIGLDRNSRKFKLFRRFFSFDVMYGTVKAIKATQHSSQVHILSFSSNLACMCIEKLFAEYEGVTL
jgi:hypothetical protein